MSMDGKELGHARPHVAVISVHYYERHLTRSLEQLQSICAALGASR